VKAERPYCYVAKTRRQNKWPAFIVSTAIAIAIAIAAATAAAVQPASDHARDTERKQLHLSHL